MVPKTVLLFRSAEEGGVTVLFASTFHGVMGKVVAEIKGRVLALTCSLGDQKCTVASIYVPNTGQEPFFKSAIIQILHTKDRDVLIGGDLNFVMSNDLDRSAQR